MSIPTGPGGPRLAAARAIFQALFDGAEAGPPLDEDRWIHLMTVFNEAGRFVFGYPHLISSESDIFGALDDIATELSATKTAIVETTREARIAQSELHKALEPLLPDEGDPVGNSRIRAHNVSGESGQPAEPPPPVTRSPDPQANQSESPPDDSADSLANDSPAVPSPVEEAPPRVGRDAPRPRQGPRYDRDAMFAAIRATPTLAAAARELGLASSTVLYARLDTLQGHGELPDDIAAKRPSVNGAMVTPKGMDRAEDRIKTFQATEADHVREVAADIKARESDVLSKNVAEMDEFMARRKANAAEQAERSWKARNA